MIAGPSPDYQIPIIIIGLHLLLIILEVFKEISSSRHSTL